MIGNPMKSRTMLHPKRLVEVTVIVDTEEEDVVGAEEEEVVVATVNHEMVTGLVNVVSPTTLAAFNASSVIWTNLVEVMAGETLVEVARPDSLDPGTGCVQ
jgi:hypothetical protein